MRKTDLMKVKSKKLYHFVSTIILQLIWRPKEEDIKPKLPLEIPLAFTVRGEACKDSCSQRIGYSYKWCKKMKPSNLGSWTDNDYCTVDSCKYMTFNV